MGLFDTVLCEYPLPDAHHQELEFQTKNLECLLERYTIRRDGRLVRHMWRGREEPERDIEWPIHGDVSIYTSDSSGAWVEYTVRFTHDRVEWIRPKARRALDAQGLAIESEPPPESSGSTGPKVEPVDTADSGSPLDSAAGDAATDAEGVLLAGLRRDRQEIERLLEACSDHWGYEDPVYRFYHQSFKVYGLQRSTESIVQRLQALAPDLPLNPWFCQIVQAGTGKGFRHEDNARWMEATRPILEAFFHARYFLEMALRYSDLQAPPRPLPSGYAALLYLFGTR